MIQIKAGVAGRWHKAKKHRRTWICFVFLPDGPPRGLAVWIHGGYWRGGARVHGWVGGGERPEFLRQNALLANIWTGLGADMTETVEPGLHHFEVIDGLRDPASPIVEAFVGG